MDSTALVMNRNMGVTQENRVSVKPIRLFPCTGAHLVVTTIHGVNSPCSALKPLTPFLKPHKRNVRRKSMQGNT